MTPKEQPALQAHGITHISYSAVRSFTQNKYEFFKRYILKEYLTYNPYAMARGDLAHQFIANCINNRIVSTDLTEQGLLDYIESILNTLEKQKPLKCGKTQSREGLIDEIRIIAEKYMNQRSYNYWGNPYDASGTTGVECKIIVPPQLTGLSLPVKVVTDLIAVSTDGNETLTTVDHKIVKSVDNAESETDIYLQAGALAFATKVFCDRYPDKIVFDKIPSSQNTWIVDKKTGKKTKVPSQIAPVSVPDITLAMEVFLDYAGSMLDQLENALIEIDTNPETEGIPKYFLPNPYDSMNPELFVEYLSQKKADMDGELTDIEL